MHLVRTILMAEDSDDDVFIMRRALRQAGITSQLHVAEDGEQAIAYLSGTGQYSDREKFPMPEVVFLDIKMPKVNGFEVMRWITERLGSPPPVVLMLSSSDEPKDREKAKSAGARSYAKKPPNSALFQEVARSFNLEWMREVGSPG